jgi:hypothetical protein
VLPLFVACEVLRILTTMAAVFFSVQPKLDRGNSKFLFAINLHEMIQVKSAAARLAGMQVSIATAANGHVTALSRLTL